MRIASLGSGSRGNGTLIEDEDTCLLVDLGFSLKETIVRLRRLSKSPEDINTILVTHEHADHISGVDAFAANFGIATRMTSGTFRGSQYEKRSDCKVVSSHHPFKIGTIEIEPIPVPHDAREPSQFIFTGGSKYRFGLLTDIGHITTHVRERYKNCDALFLECNYDAQMLADGPYPSGLKTRVGGSQGHLSNSQAAELLHLVKNDRLKYVVIGHISEKNNTPDLALEAAQKALSNWRGELIVADQKTGFPWLNMG